MAKYAIIDFKFNMMAFSEALKNVSDGDLSDFAEIIGIDDSTLRNWCIEGAKGKYPMPSMRNFINACNWLDLDPREFFVLDECQHEETDIHSWIAKNDMIRERVTCRHCGKMLSLRERQNSYAGWQGSDEKWRDVSIW